MTSAEQNDAVSICRQITAGTIPPYQGAKRIWSLFAELASEYPEEIRIFVGLASEWEDDPKHRPAYEADILEEAERLIASSADRS